MIRHVFKGSVLFCALLLSALIGTAVAERDTALPRNHISMDIVLDPQTDALSESLRVTVVNDSEDAWNEIVLRDYLASMLREDAARTEPAPGYSCGILTARCEGVALPFEADAGDPSIVRVALPGPLAPGAQCTLELTYAADLPKSGMRCAVCQLGPDGQGRSYELAQFYPIPAVYEDGTWICDPYIFDGECFFSRCADYEISLRVPENYTVVASGQESRVSVEDGVATWQIRAENMRDVTLIASSELECLSGEALGVPINCYYCATDAGVGRRRQAEFSLETAIAAFELFSAEFGAYPYDELDIVESCYEYGGMEAPALVRVSQMYSWDLEADSPDAALAESLLRGTVAHEVAHEWFYAAVGNNQYREAWLDESLAAYCENLYWRRIFGREDAVAQSMALWAEEAPAFVDLSYAELDHKYIPTVYKQGCVFLYRLEKALGAEDFLRCMRMYYAANLLREATTADFLAAFWPCVSKNEEAQALIGAYLSRAR